MFDLSWITILLMIFIAVPVAMVLAGLVIEGGYYFYLVSKDIFSLFHHPHGKGAH